ncbi:type II toxin-antitoxin system VapC family toxin [Marilutibacter maris]|uniref:Twitching mobility protein PilT n=1 Tax=Marilutibacter maris TaxID=1605891 RepID=A0A2U9TJE3_9GAMM|nr:type II toxin-antitoxin system VapC family toxin [Lysobacter maris]AWV08190.1 twitching mobility protein PilT [Lysobacter maris]
MSPAAIKRVLVDANVLLDVLTDDPQWYEWSAARLDACATEAELCINTIVYAEVSVGFERIEDLDDALPPDTFSRLELPWEAGFLAGKAFLQYRRAKGARTSPLPDFYIGAHAAIEGMALLTRDAKRYRTYYPTLELICP